MTKTSVTNSQATPTSRTIMIVAGEASGDKHGAALARHLVAGNPETRFEFFGSGGEEMRAAGVDTLVDVRDVAIIGVAEIVRALGTLYGAYRRLIAAARARRPDVVILIDWPDFNMRVARRLRRESCKIVYYISPQVWAWRRHRVKALRRDVDRMLVILPFEEAFYRQAGVEVEYVGHPLANAVTPTSSREQFLLRHHLSASRPLIALLPGSRHKEIHYHLPAMLDAAARLQGEELPPQFVLPLASTVSRAEVERQVRGCGADVTIVERQTYDVLAHADFAVVASGTATVETALAGTPMIIIYRASELNWRLLRPLIRLDTFGMVNLIAGRRIVPELIQHEVSGEAIAGTVKAILRDPARLAQMRRDLEDVREKLQCGGGDGAERAARAVMRAVEDGREVRKVGPMRRPL